MHSVQRVRTTQEQRELRRKREAVEISKFRELNDAVLRRTTDSDSLNKTAQLLSMNPEHYTVWNIRRELLSTIPPESRPQMLKNDLKLTESFLPTHPKVYWIWNHRRWVLMELEKYHEADIWGRELALVTKLLERDPRNFHGWSYRRWVVENSNISTPELEFAFTAKKINENFSNFSAWHCRSQLISSDLKTKPALQSELNYVYEAVAMDPQDQSGWLYYQWLLESPHFASEVNEKVLAEQRQLVTEIWDEESSVWAGRLLSEIALMQGEEVDAKVVSKLAELDPMRASRYQQLLKVNKT